MDIHDTCSTNITILCSKAQSLPKWQTPHLVRIISNNTGYIKGKNVQGQETDIIFEQGPS
ncbi:hypothetical protein IBE20_00660 [Francisella tularensis subsp. novicida]|uniref:Uncharacterized protein n=1 Tax=Francisella tularensis TaxID=263 RepID=A0A6I4RQF0_FRATU|nr:hypothetical protein [Francisella tularensis]AJI60375.1 hypothetical protein AW25_1086 [Francisella tularensis subsp. novicida U112]MBK2035266.1 hypothetical protein [Francisella tularensis subsp. novicida]MBK2116775.1 hypothetical protein [Francisella tularensis subsp. novicida]MBK2311611.1 hypothetical protein [Francisella tularensis subsp. novicida]MBK2315293.1 hypothetical protein [Francisella tularensis subsp. novicida]